MYPKRSIVALCCTNKTSTYDKDYEVISYLYAHDLSFTMKKLASNFGITESKAKDFIIRFIKENIK